MINYLLTNGSITLHYNGKTKVIAKDDGRFNQVLTAIREGKLDTIPTIVNTELWFANRGLDLRDGLLHVNGEAMPVELSDRIIQYKEMNVPFDSLLKFWDNLKLNPSFNSRKQLFKFLSNKGHSLTEDGMFIAYRGVTEDYKDRHTRTMSNTVGSVVEMPRDQVDDNPNNTCSYGLHVGGYDYAKDFASGGKLMLVKVNPKDVVSVPNDYEGQKMRVCKFEVLEEVTDIVTTPVYESDYDSEYDTDYNNDDDLLTWESNDDDNDNKTSF